jgi:hypothetical protein
VIQTPLGSEYPTGGSKPATTSSSLPEDDDSHSDLNSWYYVTTAEDIRKLVSWTTYLAAKAGMAADSLERGERKSPKKESLGKGSPNKLGQIFAVQVLSPKAIRRPGKGRKVYEFSGTVETRLLCEELKHAAEWIEDRYVFPCYVDLGGLRKRKKKRRRRRRRERRLLLMEKSLF